MLSNKQIVFLFEFMKEYLITLQQEEAEAKDRRELSNAMVKYSKESEEVKSSFIQAMNEISELGFNLIAQRREIITPILEHFESMYDMIAEAEPDLVNEVLTIINAEQTKQRFNEIIENLR